MNLGSDFCPRAVKHNYDPDIVLSWGLGELQLEEEVGKPSPEIPADGWRYPIVNNLKEKH